MDNLKTKPKQLSWWNINDIFDLVMKFSFLAKRKLQVCKIMHFMNTLSCLFVFEIVQLSTFPLVLLRIGFVPFPTFHIQISNLPSFLRKVLFLYLLGRCSLLSRRSDNFIVESCQSCWSKWMVPNVISLKFIYSHLIGTIFSFHLELSNHMLVLPFYSSEIWGRNT